MAGDAQNGRRRRQADGAGTRKAAPPIAAPAASRPGAEAVGGLDALTRDPQKRRRHTARNVEMLTAALRSVGAARSIVIDEHGEVLAGNGVLDAAKAAGISRVQIVDADGSTIIAVRRAGLTPMQKRDLALYDNRTSELAVWDLDRLAADVEDGLSLDVFFTDDEQRALFGADAPAEFPSVDVNIETTYRCPSCGYAWSGKPKTIATGEPAPAPTVDEP